MVGKKFEIGLSGDAINKLKEIAGGFEQADDSGEDLVDTIDDLKQGIKEFGETFAQVISELSTKINTFRGTMDKVKEGVQTSINSTKTVTENQASTIKALNDSVKSNDKVVKGMVKNVNALNDKMNIAKQNAKAMSKEYQLAERVLSKTEEKMSSRQVRLVEKQLNNLYNGKINTGTFQKRVKGISKLYWNEFNIAWDRNTQSAAALKSRQLDQKHEEKMAVIAGKYTDKKAKAAAIEAESNQKLAQSVKLGEQKLKQEKETTKQKEKQTVEMDKQNSAKTKKMQEQARKAEILADTAESRREDYLTNKEMTEIARQQKLAKNELARQIIKDQLTAMAQGDYELGTNESKKLALSTMRLKDTIRNIQNFAETGGYKGTVGASATSVLRSEQFYDNIYNQALAWKRVNSEEGKAADTLGRMIEDAKSMQSGINRIHTAFGQIASTVSAIRGIGVDFRKTITSIAQPVINMVKQISSTAFKSSLEALKDLELSQIGFANFYGQSSVPGIMQNIKQNALLSPMSASQLASYVNQIAPLSKGNSQLAIDATMGVAKMIQYSGGEVSTEMEYVIKNLRDVIAKGKALTIDIRQFNRAMPALTKVLEEMGESDMLKNGELSIDEKTAPKLLEAFQKINSYGDVATIFERTSETISGLMERLEEQMQLFVIDVGEFSGLTDLIKHTIHDLLEDSNGLLSHIKTQAQFIGRDVTNWLKTRDWERVLKIAKEVANVLWTGLKESLGILRKALGGTDWRETLMNLAETISSFIKGIANSYSWLLGIMNGLNKSGILGTGLVQGGMGLLGFLSGSAGTLITGGLRGFGNFMGTVNQITFSLLHSMEQQQAEYLKSATTIATFDEALLLAVKSLSSFGEEVLAIDTALGGVLTAEQRKMVQTEMSTHQTEIETLSKRQHKLATDASKMSIEREKAARDLNTESLKAEGGSSGGLLGAALTGKGTKIGSIISKAFRALIVGEIVGSLSSVLTEGLAGAFGADKYDSATAGNWVGSTAGFATGGAMVGSMIAPGIGTAIGGILGGLVGVIKAGIEQSGINDQKRQDELDEFKQTVNNGTYLKEILSTIEGGSNLTTSQINTINSNLVKQMNQWADSTPRGTAQMLKAYLTEININGHSIETEVKKINDDIRENASILWKYVEADEVEKGNEFGATLKEMGYSSYEISAMIYGKAAEAGKSKDEIRDYLLKWGSTDSGEGDLTLEYIQSLDETDKVAMQKKLWSAWFEIGKEGAANMNGDNADKEAFAQEFADTMSNFLVGSIEKIDEEKLLSLVDWSAYANKAGSVSTIWETLGLGMSSETALGKLNTDDDEKFKALVTKYGLSSENIMLLGNTITKTVADHEDINSIIEKMTKNQTRSEILDFQALNYMKYEKSTSDFLRSSIYPKLVDIENATKQAASGKETKEETKVYINDENGITGKSLRKYAESLKWDSNKTFANGGIVYLAAGGSPRGVDIVPAMLQPGEFVVRRSAVEKVGLTAMSALNTGNLGYFARAVGRQDVYGDYNAARTWNYSRTSNDNRKSNRVIVNNYTRGARLNRYYSLANRMI